MSHQATTTHDDGPPLPWEVVPDLVDRFADRLAAEDLDPIRWLTDCGVWEEAVDLLLACLHHAGATLSDQERHLLGALMETLEIPAILLPGSNPAIGEILSTLLDGFEGRQPPRYQAAVRAHLDGDSRAAALRLLLQHLREVGTPVTSDESETFRNLLIVMRLPIRLLDGLNHLRPGNAS